MRMIIFGGPARVGKTTAAKLLAEAVFNKGMRPMLVSFASFIKEEVESMGLTKETHPEEYRKTCQEMGASKRAEDPEYWIKKFDYKVKEVLKMEDVRRDRGDEYWEHVIIVDDCRYMNEVAYGRMRNAVLVFVSPGERELEDADAEWRNHESEHLANKILEEDKDYRDIFPWLLRNNEDESSLRNKIGYLHEIWLSLDNCSSCEDCDCELCKAKREDRLPEIETLITQILERLLELKNEEAE